MNLDPLKPYANLLRAGAALLLVALLLFAGYQWGAGSWKAKHAAAAAAHKADKERHAGVLADLAEKTAAVAEKARQASELNRKARAQVDEEYQERLTDAKRAEDSLRAALRAGEQRLQPWWDCGRTDAGAGDAAADAAEADAGRRADSTARIVGAADRDAALIEALWDGWKADRDAVIAAGCAVEAR